MANVKALIKDAGKNLSAKEVQKIAEKTGYTAQSIVNRAEKADVKIQPSAQSFVQEAAKTQAANTAQQIINRAPTGTTTEIKTNAAGQQYGVYTPTGPAPESNVNNNAVFVPPVNPNPAVTASLPEVESANSLAAALVQERIRALENAGQTERLKYEVDNRVPVVQAESKGKLDLQKIVNSGYKEIAQIERGSKMMGNITSMFNF